MMQSSFRQAPVAQGAPFAGAPPGDYSQQMSTPMGGSMPSARLGTIPMPHAMPMSMSMPGRGAPAPQVASPGVQVATPATYAGRPAPGVPCVAMAGGRPGLMPQQVPMQMQQSAQQGAIQQAMPQQAMPQQAMFQQGMPQQGMPQQGMPQQVMFQPGMPQHGMPQPGMPQPGMPPQARAAALPQQPQQPQEPPIEVVEVLPAAPAPPPPEAATDEADHDFKVGDIVKFNGIAHDPKLQDRLYRVEVPNVGDGRILVKFDESERVSKKLYFDPAVLELVEQQGTGQQESQENAGDLAAGARVRIVGLVVRPEYDGKFGWVTSNEVTPSGNMKVQLDGTSGTQVLEIPPSYLEPVFDGATPPADLAFAAAPVVPESFGGFRIGERVQIVNLVGRPQHQGRTGIVESVDPTTGTVLVDLDEKTEMAAKLSLNPAHLQSLDNPADAQSLNVPATMAPNEVNMVATGPTIMSVPPAGPTSVPAAMPDFAGMAPQAAMQAPQMPEQVPGPAQAPGGMQPGAQVRIKGLEVARPQYNGQVGVIEAMQPGGDYMVTLDGATAAASTRLVLNAQYLEPLA